MRVVAHRHVPVYRVIRRGWADPLDTSFSQQRGDNRWNTPEFSALYCCCSVRVAAAVADDVFELAALVFEDLQPNFRPELAEVRWAGRAVDVASREGIVAAGFDVGYPEGATITQTQRAASQWHGLGAEAVVCRSASLWRKGVRRWGGDHQRWGELAIFTANARRAPILTARRQDLNWLRPAAETSG